MRKSLKTDVAPPLALGTNSTIDSDEQLISLWKTMADESALSRLAIRYLPQFYRTARAMMMSPSESEDIAQEVMLKIIRGLPSFSGDSGFRVWSYTILLNTIRSEHSRAKRHGRVSIDANGPGSVSVESRLAAPSEHSLTTELQAAFQEALSRLTDTQRTALILQHIDGLPADEIAMLLNCSVDAVYQRTAEAKRKLRTDVNLRALWTEHL